MKWISCFLVLIIIGMVVSGAQAKTKEEWFKEGQRYFASHDYEKAINAYNQYLKINPNNAGALINKASSLNNLHRYQEATSVIQQAMKLDYNRAKPWGVTLQVNYGNELVKQGKYQEAINSYKNALNCDPESDTEEEIRKKIKSAQQKIKDVASKKSNSVTPVKTSTQIKTQVTTSNLPHPPVSQTTQTNIFNSNIPILVILLIIGIISAVVIISKNNKIKDQNQNIPCYDRLNNVIDQQIKQTLPGNSNDNHRTSHPVVLSSSEISKKQDCSSATNPISQKGTGSLSGNSYQLNNTGIIEIMQKIISLYGNPDEQNPARFRSVMQDLLVDYERERNLLMAVLDRGIVSKIISEKPDLENAIFIRNCVSQMHNSWGMDELAAEWSIKTWIQVMKSGST